MAYDALYYPYTSVQSLDSLKAMVLYFDVIHVISPSEVSIDDTSSVRGAMSVLENEGMIKYVSPTSLLQKYDNVMTQSVVGDLLDPEFTSLCRTRAGARSSLIYAEKLPSAWADATFRKYLVNLPNFYDGVNAGNRIREHAVGPLEERRRIYEGPFEKRRRIYEGMREVSERRGSTYRMQRIVELPFEVGRIDHGQSRSLRV